MNNTRGCRWCSGLPCLGDGYLDADGSGDPCGADHIADGYPMGKELETHSCSACGTYTCGIHSLDRGLCPDCGDPDEAAAVLASGQSQPESDDSEE